MSSLLELVIHNAETKEAQMKWEGSKAIAVNIETTDVTGSQYLGFGFWKCQGGGMGLKGKLKRLLFLFCQFYNLSI